MKHEHQIVRLFQDGPIVRLFQYVQLPSCVSD